MERPFGPSSPGAAVELHDFTLTAGGRALLRQVNALFEPGKVTLIVGASGAGKSLLLRTIAGLLDASHKEIAVTGRLTIGGREMIENGEHARGPRSVGVVFQQFALFDELSPAENVRFAFAHRTRQRTTSAKELAPDALLDELQIPRGVRTSALSGGQQQRLAIARTLTFNPDVILYDEPTSGLDSATAEQVATLIRRTHDSHPKTSIIVTHDYESLTPIADAVFLLDAATQSLRAIPREAWGGLHEALIASAPGREDEVASIAESGSLSPGSAGERARVRGSDGGDAPSAPSRSSQHLSSEQAQSSAQGGQSPSPQPSPPTGGPSRGRGGRSDSSPAHPVTLSPPHPVTPSPPHLVTPSPTHRTAAALADFLIASSCAFEAAIALPWRLIPRWSSQTWGLRYLLHYLRLVAGPSAWAYVAMVGLIIGFVTTHFTFKFIPYADYTEPLIIEDLLKAVGYALWRILMPIFATVLIAARCGAAVASDVGNKTWSKQVDALRSFGAAPSSYLLTNILYAFLVGVPVLTMMSFAVARWTSLVVFTAAYPERGPYFWEQHFHAELNLPGHVFYSGIGWVLAKVTCCAAGIALIAYHQGARPKPSNRAVSSGITSAILWATLYVLVVHFVFAFIEFEKK